MTLDKPELTEVLHGAESVQAALKNFFARAKTRLDICANDLTPNQQETTQDISEAYLEAGRRGARLRVITEITKDNADFLKSVKDRLAIRHISGLRGNFGVSDNEYLATPGGERLGLSGPLLYSNETNFVKQHQALYDKLWESAVPAEIKIRQINEKTVPIETKIIRTSNEIKQAIISFIERAGPTGNTHSVGCYLYWIAGKNAPASIMPFLDQLSHQIHLYKPDFKALFILDIQRENLEYIKKMIQAGLEVRHIDGNNIRFLVSASEQIDVISGRFENDMTLPSEILISNSPEQVTEAADIFLSLWQGAVPSDLRIKQIEGGTQLGETRFTFDTHEIMDAASKFVDQMKEEALILVSREGSIRENLAFFKKIASTAKQNGAKVRILGRFSKEDERILKDFHLESLFIRRIETSQTLDQALGIYDRKGMGLVQYMYPPSAKDSMDQTYLSGIISSNRAIIAGIAAIFESLWKESEMRESEELNRKRAELMQDILTHDVRNRNQAILLNAELLQDELKGNEKVNLLIDRLIKSVHLANDLLEKASRLDRVVSEREATLYPVDLIQVMERSVSLVKSVNPEKEVSFTLEALSSGDQKNEKIYVHADNLLSEVFVNLFSNSARYTKSNKVNIYATIENSVDRPNSTSYLKVSVMDDGIGIPDEMKERVFDRYLRSAKGTGLGLSIVQALVVERYGGNIKIKNRVEGDYTKGVAIDVWLRREIAPLRETKEIADRIS
jgi:signal transduction histidine kinase